MTHMPQCFDCKFYVRDSTFRNRTCSAFPDGIPGEIWSEMLPHYKPMKNQVGEFVFPLSPDKKRQITELIESRDELEKEVVDRMNDVMIEINQRKESTFIRGEIRLRRESMWRRNSFFGQSLNVLLFDENNNTELATVSSRLYPLISTFKNILEIESIVNHKTDLEFVIYKDGKYELEFTDATPKEWKDKNKIIRSILREKSRSVLLKKGLKKVTDLELEKQIMQVYKHRKEVNILSSTSVMRALQGEGYAVLREEIRELKDKLGLTRKKLKNDL